MKVKLKVCGITSLQDARAAIDCGAEYLGFNFYPASPRFIEITPAREIIEQLPRGIIPVGVFVNEPRPENVIVRMHETRVQMAQLHGDEDADYCRRVGAERVIKAMRTGGDFNPESIYGYPARAILLDAFDKDLYGGTGKTANWKSARRAARLATVFLAGGLAPENIAEAIRAVEPFAVDVNSGVESVPGKKDLTRLRQLREEMEKLK
ncbi:MAG: phosphoribosylanthranilate isomerase [Blastocatellia bacterium]